MAPVNEPLSTSILAIMYFGDVVFAISGALTAARYRMDVLGFVLIGTITGIGGGTTRDLLLGRTVWWTQDPLELILCVVASLITFFYITSDITRRKGMIWSDTLGLSVFGVVGCHVALEFGARPVSGDSGWSRSRPRRLSAPVSGPSRHLRNRYQH
ncbi:MAG: TRIC cation channel family protein [Desulfobacterales bacterium]